jgi:Undecaprenyl-phosphate galactose phosphotransferase WbaP
MTKMLALPKPYIRTYSSGHYARQRMTFALVLTDTLSFILAFGLAILFRIVLLGETETTKFLDLWPILLLFILVFALRDLYPAVGLNPVDELRITTSTTSLIFLMLLAGTFWFKSTDTYSRLILTLAWLFSLVLVQVDRWLLRIVGKSFWGEPIVVFGEGPNTDHIVNYLQSHHHLGLNPLMILRGNLPPNQTEREALQETGISTAILVSREISEETMAFMINEGHFKFRRVILISSMGWVGSLGVTTHDLEGILGMEVRQNLLNFWQRTLKRLLDILLGILTFTLVSPLLLFVSIAIKLDGKGGILFKQRRAGRGGHQFEMLKFRTMVPDADQILQDCLEADPELMHEWGATQKLKKDPRLTRVGRFLRKWSIDELPQLINVIRGEMSLVGPRPFFSEQTHYYGKVLKLYNRVRPGMTGMWQVSGRNMSTYADRVRLDEYYIRNWSCWLDIYIMFRTLWVVVLRQGAY